MNLDDILKAKQHYRSFSDFAEMACEELIQHIRKKLTAEQQLAIEKAVTKELIKDGKIHPFTRRKSQKTHTAYETAYYKRFHTEYEQTTEEAVLEAALNTDIIYVGDFHPLKQPKDTVLKIARQLTEHDKKIIIAIEPIPSRKQSAVNAYITGGSPTIPFNSGFYKPEELYGAITRFAKQHPQTAQLLAIGPALTEDGDFTTSDKQMAVTITKTMRQNTTMLVFVGDHHTAPENLPAQTTKLSGKINPLIIYQNSTPIYWHLREKGPVPEAVKLSNIESCLFNTTPMVKYQSHIDELEEHETETTETSPEHKISKILASIYLFLIADNPALLQGLREE